MKIIFNNYISFPVELLKSHLKKKKKTIHSHSFKDNHEILNVFDKALERTIKILKPYAVCFSTKYETNKKNCILTDNGIHFKIGNKIAEIFMLSDLLIGGIITCGIDAKNVIKDTFDDDCYAEWLTHYILSESLEKIADSFLSDFEKKCFPDKIYFSKRFSPGYCGWNIKEQKKIFLQIKDNQSIIKISKSGVLSPLKSISFMICVSENEKIKNMNCCALCNAECAYRR